MEFEGEIVVGIDVGTTKVATVVGLKKEGDVEVIGLGLSSSEGLRKGVVVNLDRTIDSIRDSVSDAEKSAGVEIRRAIVGISGAHIKSFNSHAVEQVKNPREVVEEDVIRVLEKAKAVELPHGREILHVLTQEFIVDENEGIKDPRGMTGYRLEAKVHIVTNDIPSAENLVRCVQKAGISVDDTVFSGLASSEAVITPEEKEVGVMLLDFGGGTVDMTVFHNGAIRHAFVLPLGGIHITSDIAIGLKVPQSDAENLKKTEGCALVQRVRRDDLVELPGVGGRKPKLIRRQFLAEIIEPRVEEIFQLINRELYRSGYEEALGAGVVLTGGSSHLDSITDLAERVFKLPVRKGVPSGIGGVVDLVDDPSCATGVGLVIYGSRYLRRELAGSAGERGNGILGKFKRFIKEFF